MEGRTRRSAPTSSTRCTARQGDDGAGVDAAAQEDAERHVAHEVARDGVLEERAENFDGFLAAPTAVGQTLPGASGFRAARTRQIPVLADRALAVAPGED